MISPPLLLFFFFFNDTATTEIYTLSLHDALPIYVLNVAVSIAAGVHNLASLFGALAPYVVPIGIALVALMMILNLRGVRESGSIFALPTYFFIVSALLLIVVGLTKAFVLHHQPVIGEYATVKALEPLS